MRESYRHISIQLKQINCIQLAPHAAAANPCPTAVVVVDSLILQFALVLVNCTCCCKYTIMRTTTKSQIYSFRRNSCPLLKCFQEFTLTHLTRQGDRPLTKQRTAKSRQLLKSFHTFLTSVPLLKSLPYCTLIPIPPALSPPPPPLGCIVVPCKIPGSILH